jgi:hypothetical protein
VLNSFGRAFKAGGYTMTGAQEKIEGDGLSIPNTLNLAVVTNMQYQKTNGDTTGTTPTTKNSSWVNWVCFLRQPVWPQSRCLSSMTWAQPKSA